jgi:hypothetical protein
VGEGTKRARRFCGARRVQTGRASPCCADPPSSSPSRCLVVNLPRMFMLSLGLWPTSRSACRRRRHRPDRRKRAWRNPANRIAATRHFCIVSSLDLSRPLAARARDQVIAAFLRGVSNAAVKGRFSMTPTRAWAARLLIATTMRSAYG